MAHPTDTKTAVYYMRGSLKCLLEDIELQVDRAEAAGIAVVLPEFRCIGADIRSALRELEEISPSEEWQR